MVLLEKDVVLLSELSHIEYDDVVAERDEVVLMCSECYGSGNLSVDEIITEARARISKWEE